MRTMSSSLLAMRSQVSPVAMPLRPGAAPTGAAAAGSNASHTPMEGRALEFEGKPDSLRACVTTVKMRLPRTGKVNQSVWPIWLKRPHHIPPVGMGRGWDTEPIASLKPATGVPATVTLRVCVDPGDRLENVTEFNVPEGETWPCV